MRGFSPQEQALLGSMMDRLMENAGAPGAGPGAPCETKEEGETYAENAESADRRICAGIPSSPRCA